MGQLWQSFMKVIFSENVTTVESFSATQKDSEVIKQDTFPLGYYYNPAKSIIAIAVDRCLWLPWLASNQTKGSPLHLPQVDPTTAWESSWFKARDEAR